MFELIRRVYWWVRDFLAVASLQNDIRYRKKWIRKLCKAAESQDWDACDDISFRLYGKPYIGRPKGRKK